MLSKTGNSTATGGGDEAARNLYDFGWATKTWNNRSSQLAKWRRFCDEDIGPLYPHVKVIVWPALDTCHWSDVSGQR